MQLARETLHGGRLRRQKNYAPDEQCATSQGHVVLLLLLFSASVNFLSALLRHSYVARRTPTQRVLGDSYQDTHVPTTLTSTELTRSILVLRPEERQQTRGLTAQRPKSTRRNDKCFNVLS